MRMGINRRRRAEMASQNPPNGIITLTQTDETVELNALNSGSQRPTSLEMRS